jgi:hypothetical protein
MTRFVYDDMFGENPLFNLQYIRIGYNPANIIMNKNRNIYIRGRLQARDYVGGNLQHDGNSKSNNGNNSDKSYRVSYESDIPQIVRIRHENIDINDHTSDNSEELILDKPLTITRELQDNFNEDSDDACNIIADLESEESVDSTQDIRTEINSFLMGLENRYTDKTPYRVCNRMYSIGLDIAVSPYTDKEIESIIEQAVYDCSHELNTTDVLDEIKVYNKKKILEYIRAGVKDGLTNEYAVMYHCVYEGRPLVDNNNKTAISNHLGTMFSKYTDSADPNDLEQFYNVGILIANKPFNRERMVSKLRRIITDKSKDDVIEIQQNKRIQLLEKMNQGYQNSLDRNIRDAYDVNGIYNYSTEHRERLRNRARIDATIKRMNT